MTRRGRKVCSKDNQVSMGYGLGQLCACIDPEGIHRLKRVHATGNGPDASQNAKTVYSTSGEHGPTHVRPTLESSVPDATASKYSRIIEAAIEDPENLLKTYTKAVSEVEERSKAWHSSAERAGCTRTEAYLLYNVLAFLKRIGATPRQYRDVIEAFTRVDKTVDLVDLVPKRLWLNTREEVKGEDRAGLLSLDNTTASANAQKPLEEVLESGKGIQVGKRKGEHYRQDRARALCGSPPAKRIQQSTGQLGYLWDSSRDLKTGRETDTIWPALSTEQEQPRIASKGSPLHLPSELAKALQEAEIGARRKTRGTVKKETSRESRFHTSGRTSKKVHFTDITATSSPATETFVGSGDEGATAEAKRVLNTASYQPKSQEAADELVQGPRLGRQSVTSSELRSIPPLLRSSRPSVAVSATVPAPISAAQETGVWEERKVEAPATKSKLVLPQKKEAQHPEPFSVTTNRPKERNQQKFLTFLETHRFTPSFPYDMAAVKKYAGLPDLDLGTEIYETAPDLTEASTLPDESEALSEDDNPNLDRKVLDRDAARERFGGTVVNANDVNFSDTIDGGRRDYRIRTRRRRRRAARAESQEDGDYTDSSEDETLQGRLARLKREAAELQADIEEQEQKEAEDEDADSDYEDTIDHHDQAQRQEDLSTELQTLNKTLDGVSTSSRRKKGLTLEEELTNRLNQDPIVSTSRQEQTSSEQLPQSSISAIAAFSDRLAALETTLGVSALQTSTSSSVFPTLDMLHTQIETLYSTLSPRSDPMTQNSQSVQTTSTVHLDPLSQKIKLLVSESKRLEDSRRAATKSFEELLETRDRHAHFLTSSHSHSAVHAGTEARMSRTPSSQDVNGRPASGVDGNTFDRKEDMQQHFTTLFLDDQATKITALYKMLPDIQQLRPLLPVVLERLRALSVIHDGAANVKGELDELENRLAGQEKDVRKWREAVDDAEKSMKDGREVMKENVQTVGNAVRGLERRMKELSRG